MVAIQSLDTAPALDRAPAPAPVADGRPHLVLLQGGRSETAAPGSPSMHSIHRRRRLAAAVLVVALVVGAAVGVVAGLQVLGGSAGSGPLTAPAAATSAGAPALVEPSTIAPGATSVVVGPGDTLWGIARQITPAGGDVAATVERLVARNGGVASLQPGMRLL
ncbi:MAG: LysM peptidoglycan-binding domain-containing protein, partial [Acidimicrobiales bacterium]|nr:LysM peptidoglycan-binding domain-containing protein [Acidimicrobiales bacterium]